MLLWKNSPPSLTGQQKKELIALGNQTLVHYLRHHKIMAYKPADELLERLAAVFVTLRIRSLLRGCVGGIAPDLPLYQAVQQASISAAISDPRFPPLQINELRNIHIKISILSPLVPITPEEIEIGKHGLLIKHQGRRGLLLPEVAGEHNWDVNTYLENLTYKAGLPAHALEESPGLYGFSTLSFSD